MSTCPKCWFAGFHDGRCEDCGHPDTPPAPEPAAAPPVDTEVLRALTMFSRWSDHQACMTAAADELDAHRARHAELVALVAELREDGAKFKQYGYIGIANALARILGEQP